MKKMILLTASLVASYLGTGSANPLRYDQPDSRFTIANKNIVIQSDIVVYGKGATRQITQQIRENILKYWALSPDKKPWQYWDEESQSQFTVKFDVNVSLYQGLERNEPRIIPEAWDPTNRKNYIEIAQGRTRAFVMAGDEGVWSNPPSREQTFAHEYGHLLGFDDRYNDGPDGYGVSNPGWDGNMMAGGDFVEQRNIDALMERVMTKYRTSPTYIFSDQDLRNEGAEIQHQGSINPFILNM